MRPDAPISLLNGPLLSQVGSSLVGDVEVLTVRDAIALVAMFGFALSTPASIPCGLIAQRSYSLADEMIRQSKIPSLQDSMEPAAGHGGGS